MRHSMALLLLVVFPLLACRAEDIGPQTLGFVKGFTWGWDGRRGTYDSDAADASLARLADTGAVWVCVVFAANMESSQNPDFTWGDRASDRVSGKEVRHAIDLARSRGLKVILKPTVNCRDGIWRAWIKFYRPLTDTDREAGLTGEVDPWGEETVTRSEETNDLEKWDIWWDNYTRFLQHYAQIAEEKCVPVLCLGCEMSSTEEFEDRWRALIGKVCEKYRGLLTYDSNHGRENSVGWWDAVDFLSISAYFATPLQRECRRARQFDTRLPRMRLQVICKASSVTWHN